MSSEQNTPSLVTPAWRALADAAWREARNAYADAAARARKNHTERVTGSGRVFIGDMKQAEAEYYRVMDAYRKRNPPPPHVAREQDDYAVEAALNAAMGGHDGEQQHPRSQVESPQGQQAGKPARDRRCRHGCAAVAARAWRGRAAGSDAERAGPVACVRAVQAPAEGAEEGDGMSDIPEELAERLSKIGRDALDRLGRAEEERNAKTRELAQRLLTSAADLYAKGERGVSTDTIPVHRCLLESVSSMVRRAIKKAELTGVFLLESRLTLGNGVLFSIRIPPQEHEENLGLGREEEV